MTGSSGGRHAGKARRRTGEDDRLRHAGALVIVPNLTQRARQTARSRAVRRTQSAHAPGRLEEAVGLAAAIDLNVVQGILVRLAPAAASHHLGKGKVEEISGLIAAEEIDLVIDGLRADPGAAAQPREGLGRQGHRPDGADPGDLRPAGAHQGRRAAGRARRI